MEWDDLELSVEQLDSLERDAIQQAIVVTTCIRESWPVLILTPPSLRLHWESAIQQWLKIPTSDILVVLSQCGAGFTIVSPSNRGTIQLDGVFNIISYDLVPKLQNLLMSSEFKVVIADESHFLKNYQAKSAMDVVQSKMDNLGQMLDGHENVMEVCGSQPKAKSITGNQTTMESYMKRCSNSGESEHEPKLKYLSLK